MMASSDRDRMTADNDARITKFCNRVPKLSAAGYSCTLRSGTKASGVQADAIIVLIVVILLVIALFYVNWRRKQLAVVAHDFHTDLMFLKSYGELGESGDAKCRVPREIKRGCVKRLNLIGAGQYGEVWKGVLDEHTEKGGVPGYPVVSRRRHYPRLFKVALLHTRCEKKNAIGLDPLK